ncbi:hypothetical protein V8E54_003027 [Elaphomyces granulatus]
MLFTSVALLALSATAKAHTAAWKKGMYCFGGNVTGEDNSNGYLPINPLYNLTKEDWWWQHDRGCDLVPPAPGDFLEIPAGGSFTVELAHNRAFTTLSYGGKLATDWPDGKQRADGWNDPTCLTVDGAMHTTNQSWTGGTAFAISYHSNLADVTLENLVVFTVLKGSPWKRLATYQVPADLPPCPPGGCHVAWLWVPRQGENCGQQNMYMHGFKAMVTGSTSNKTLAAAKVPVYCGDGKNACVTGAKQMLVFHQLTGNNVERPTSGNAWTYSDTVHYGEAWGFNDGAQEDIFEGDKPKC